MFIRAKYMLQFARSDGLQNTGQFDLAIENRRIVWPFKLREARQKEAFHTITDFTLLHVFSRTSK